MTSSLLDKFLKSSPEQPIYHYTSSDALMSILDSGQIWMTHVRHLNDFTEFNHALDVASSAANDGLSSATGERRDYLKAVLEGLDVLRRDQDQLPYVSSFCEARDALSLWRGYSPREGAVNFGFDWSPFDTKEHGVFVTRCWYKADEKRQIIQEMLDRYFEEDPARVRVEIAHQNARFREGASDGAIKGTWFTWLFSFYAPGFKHEAFEDEREWRAILPPPKTGMKPKFRPGRTGPIPYVPFSLFLNGDLKIQEIVVGPTADAEASLIAFKRYISSLNGRNDRLVHISCGDVVASGVPLRFV